MLEQMLCWSLCPTAQGGPWPHGVPIAGSGSARTWPLAPTAISPSLPAQEASCPFGRMGEMEKAPPLPWANTAPLSSYPGERNSQVPAGTVTSPPGNAFPRPAGKGALVSLKELLASPLKAFPSCFHPGWGWGMQFWLGGEGVLPLLPARGAGLGCITWGRQLLQTHKLLWRRGASTIHLTTAEILPGA